MKNHKLMTVLAVSVGLLATGCGGEETRVVPGTVTVSLTSPGSADGAILLTVRGPGMTNPTVTNSSNQLFSRLVAPQELKIIIVGNITTGPLVTVDVPNLNDLSGFSGSVDQIADRNDDLRTDLSGYSLAFPEPAPSSSGVLAPTR